MDLGQTQRGVDMGPSAMRYAGLSRRLARLGYRTEDEGNLAIRASGSVAADELWPAIRDACDQVYDRARQAVEQDSIPLFLGGDHSISIGTVGGVTHSERCGVLWIDAHGDFNTPQTSPSGNIHGMPLAILLGRGDEQLVNLGRPGPTLCPEDVVVMGLRQLDTPEREALKQSGTTLFTMRDIDERGASEVARAALAKLAHLPRLHVSLDVDVLDPREAPGVGTAVPGGLTYREAQVVMEIIADAGRLASMDIVEVNPILDHENRTGTMAVELAVSALGKSIL
jgi:arginase